MGQVFWSVMRERTNPGQITDTLMRYCLRFRRKASPQALTPALVALYDGQAMRP